MSIIVLFAFCVLLCMVRVLFGIEEMPDLLIWALIGLFLVVFVGEVKKKMQIKACASALMCALLLRIVFIFIDLYLSEYYTLPNSGADSEMFYWGAVRVAHGGESHRGFFVYVMGYVFAWMGISRLWGQFLISLCSIVSLVMAYKIFLESKCSQQNIKIFMNILCLLPNYAVLSSIFVREAIIAMFFSMSLYYFILWMTRNSFRCFVFAILLCIPSITFHGGMVVVPLAYLVVHFFYRPSLQAFSFSIFNLLISMLLLVIFTYFITRYSEAGYVSKITNIESLEDVANINDAGNSSYAQYVGNSNSPLHFILYTPLRIFFFLFSPLPIFWRGLSDVIAFCFSSMFYLLAYYRIFQYFKSSSHESIERCLIIALCIVALCTVFVFGWGVSNAGTACRHRDKVAVLYGVLLALTTKSKKCIRT